MQNILIQILLLFISTVIFAQGEINTESKAFIRNERTFSISLNSNGYGINYRIAKRLDGFRKKIYDVDLAEIKHPKETKTSNPYFENQKRFIYGKENNFYNLHLGIGLQKELFSKFDNGGISIKYFYSGGLSCGIQKPIYYEILYPTSNPYEYIIVVEQLNTEKQEIDDIYGRAPYFKGFDKLSLKPGLYFKFGVSFEYSKNEKRISAIETGINIDAFYKKIIIMQTKENNQLFLSLYISFRFGRIINGRIKEK